MSYGIHYGDALVVYCTQASRILILEYKVHGRILSNGAPYDNRLISMITTDNRKIVYGRDYMDSLAACTALYSVSRVSVAPEFRSLCRLWRLLSPRRLLPLALAAQFADGSWATRKLSQTASRHRFSEAPKAIGPP